MRDGGAERRAATALRTLLRLYPSSFRSTLGDDLVETTLHRWREAGGGRRRAGRVVGRVGFWWTEGVRFAVDGMLERGQQFGAVRDELVRASRRLWRVPGRHGLAVLILGLGVGATATIFTVADAVVFRPLPYPGARSLFLVHSQFAAVRVSANSLPNLRDLQSTATGMAWLAGAQERSPALTDGRRTPERLSTLDITPEYLPGLGARVAIGRPFGEADYAAGAERVAIVSDGFWRRRWGADPAILGATIRLDTLPYIVVGVMRRSFRDPEPIESGAPTDAWLPARTGDRAFQHRDRYSFALLGRLADGVSIESAGDRLTAAGARLAAAYPDINRYDGSDLDFRLISLHERTVRDARARMLLLAVASLLLLLLACSNAANLFLARGVTRAPELAVRTALGASRRRLAFQLFAEALMTAAVAGSVGGLLGGIGLRLFVAAAPAGVPRLHEVSLDGRALLLIAALTAVAAVVFGTLPALRGARAAAASSSGSRATASRAVRRLQSALVATEVALALVLVAGSALLLGSLREMLDVDPGFEGDGVTVAELRPPVQVNSAVAQQLFYRVLLDRFRAERGVVDVALARTVPGETAGAWSRVSVERAEGAGDPAPSQAPAYGAAPSDDFLRINPVSADYFRALGIPLRAGRAFEGDPGEGDPLVVVLDEAAARRLFPDDALPLGRRVALGLPGSDAALREVIGIARLVKQRGAASEPEPQIYLPYRQRDTDRLSLVLAAPDAPLTEDRIRAIVAEVAPGVPVDRVAALSERWAATAQETRFLAFLLSVFGAVGLLLAAAGVYAAADHALSRRVPELAIRIALGARPARVFARELANALRVAVIGIVAGLALTRVGARLLESHLFGVTPGDPVTLAGAAALIAACVVAAATVSARRAARVEPRTAMYE